MAAGMRAIFLTGARGSGKTTLGRMTARSLGLPFCDLDQRIQEAAGMAIAEIVERGGWPEFRRLETAALMAAGGGQVVSTGGGVILAPGNREFMRRAGTVIWLKAPADCLHARLSRSPAYSQRPSLTGLDPLDEIAQVLKEREPLYEGCCHHIVDGSRPAQLVCADILSLIRK